MIVCTNCGNHNDDSDEFCGSCGKFLEWVGQRIETPAPEPEVEAAPEVVPHRAGLIDRVKVAVGIEEGGRPVGGDDGRAQEERQAEQEAEKALQAQHEAEAALQAQHEAETKAAADAEAARRAEREARHRAEDEERARAEAERRREAEAEAARRAEEEHRAVAAAEAAAAAARAASSAEDTAVTAAALEEAKRSEERAQAAADAEARARQEAEDKARQEAEARHEAEEQARQRAAEEARAKAAAQARAREEEEARKRAAALLQRSRPAPSVEAPPQPQPVTRQPVAQQPVARQPVAQQPSSTKTPPRPDPKVKPADKVVKTGDLVCGQCGEGNDPIRKFCRKCGNSLAQAVAAKKIPWWKRLFSRKPRASKEAGRRSSKVKAAREASFKVQIFLNTLRRLAMVLAFLGVAGAVAVPSARSVILGKGTAAFRSVQNLINPRLEPVNAVEVVATSAVPGHEASFANDLGSNTYWAEGVEGEGIGQTISFSFESKVDLAKVTLRSGAADSPDNFLKQPRPKRLHLAFDNGGSADIVLKDDLKPQVFNLKDAKGVSRVDIAIVEVYKGQVGSDTAIAEVEFRKLG